VRLSGPKSAAIAGALIDRPKPLRPRYATLARILDLDEAIVTLFEAPRSYTGEDVVEISVHGSPVVLRGIVRAAQAQGARVAEPGEFTLRAFLHGRVDLIQAEAVIDLVEAVTPLQARAAFDQLEGTLTRRIRAVAEVLFDLMATLEASLDFPDEGYHFADADEVAGRLKQVRRDVRTLLSEADRGRVVREGARVVIVGRTNSGKSTLFNALAGQARVIVSAEPGTTRDFVTEVVDLNGVPVTLVDTAGFRDDAGGVEQEGIARARQAIGVATVALVVADRSRPLDEQDRAVLRATEGARRIVVGSKNDLAAAWNGEELGCAALPVAAVTGEGMAMLRDRLKAELAGEDGWHDAPGISNLRHIALLEAAEAHLAHAESAVRGEALPEELVLSDLQRAQQALDEIRGVRAHDAVLRHIFERFCIGK